MQHIDEFERSLPDRLRAAAAELEPDPAALGAVRVRASARPRRKVGARTLVASAAAVVALVAALAVWSGGGTRDAVTAGPDQSPPSTAPVSSASPVGPEDATLVIYRYPNATAEMILEDPKMGGEWAMLHTAERTYYANGPLAELGAESPSEESVLSRGFADLDAGLTVEAFGAFPDEVVGRLTQMLMSGVGSAPQVARIRELLATFPDVTVTPHDGQVSITVASIETTFTYDEPTGLPLSQVSTGGIETNLEYVSVTRVRASDLLVPGRGTPLSTSTTTTTTEVGG
jgi:hypothetical protein